MSIEDVKTLCVTNFPTSRSRPAIMEGLEKALRLLHDHNISAEVWLDGSFMTKKIDPADVDIVVAIHRDAFDGGTEVIKSVILHFDNSDYLKTLYCDAYVLFMLPDTADPILREAGEINRKYWIQKFGTSRGSDEKGNKLNHYVDKGLALVKTPFNGGSLDGGLNE